MPTDECVEDAVQPVPLWGMLILWSACGYCTTSAVALFLCDSVPEWGLFNPGDQGSALFCGGITTLLFVVFTAYFILFRGIRFRIYPDRIEYQRGRSFVPFAQEVIVLDLADLKAIRWKISDNNPTDTAHIELIFNNRSWPFQLHKPFHLNSPVVFMALLTIFWGVLFVRWRIINRYRRNRPPNLTVGDLVKEFAEQRPDRSIRANGLPYTQEEILQGVAEALCEALAVEPEEVTMDARIIKDLGAE